MASDGEDSEDSEGTLEPSLVNITTEEGLRQTMTGMQLGDTEDDDTACCPTSVNFGEARLSCFCIYGISFHGPLPQKFAKFSGRVALK
jgi:hypothetical protein